MSDKVSFTLRRRNPDVLTCIANLSNDEVFTPPDLANQMLDQLAGCWARNNKGADLWSDHTIRFLDPCTKSGVFLREITARLTKGLEQKFPVLEDRVDHILTKQIFGIATTQLTSMMSRRSIYCSKKATGTHSVANSFGNEHGNIWFQRVEHSWVNNRCSQCGASKLIMSRDGTLESHAYEFIHAEDIKSRIVELFGENMQFDVIIGNPPYQLQDSGHSASAVPIYHRFVEQAMNLEPRFLMMITPSRWFVGGKGLSEFRSRMLEDRRLRIMVDFIVEKDAFPKVNVNGGVNYFLWDRDNQGDCVITTVEPGGAVGASVSRALSEFDVFVRRNEAVSILRKVHQKGERTFDHRVSPRKPFGLQTDFFGKPTKSNDKDLKLYSSGKITWVSRSEIPTRLEWVDEWKVLIAAATDGNENYPLPIWDQGGPFIAGPGEACSETYLVASIAGSETEAKRLVSYMRTKFFRFLVSLRKIAQHNKSENFRFVPDIPMDRVWSDQDLYARYGITDDEASYIEAMIRTMGWADE